MKKREGYWKGKKLSKRHRKNLSKSHIGNKGILSGMFGKKHTIKTRLKISKSLTGKKQSEKTKKRRGIYRKADKSPSWKGDNAKVTAIHMYIAKNKLKPKLCVICNEQKPYELANIKNHKYTHNLGDYLWVCRRCHRELDRNKKYES